MKTNYLLLTAVAALLITMTACGGKNKNGGDEDSRYTTQEELQDEEESEEAGAADVVYGELGIFELRGPVKTCETTSNGETRHNEFDENGFVTILNGQRLNKVFPKITRDEQGRMQHCSYDAYDETHCEYTFNDEGLVVSVIDWPYMDGGTTITYTYNDKGECTQIDVQEMGMDAEEPYSVRYTIEERDSHGNWTRRKADSATETRVISYYE